MKKIPFILLTVVILMVNTFKLMASGYAVERLEPPFWWSGMQNSELQLLVYGEKIAELTPALEYSGVVIKKVVRVPNPNYLFVYLTISADANPGTFDLVFKRGDVVATVFPYELRTRSEGSAYREGYTTADVMYLITPDRFVNGDTSNDNIPGMLEKANRNYKGGRHGGDIRGIINSLDYLHDMGFTAIWVNPVLENDMPAYSYHGYAATDFYRVDPRFGSNSEYVELSEKAAEKGIKLIMDMILNHCGSKHWWMDDLPTTDWINFGGQYVNTNHRRTTQHDSYASGWDKKHFVDGWFVPTMPDLNQRNPLLATYLIQNTIWWIEYAGIDGIRMDTYPYPDKHFMADWTCAVMHEYPYFNIVGEEWSENPVTVAYWQRGKDNPDDYTSCLPGLMDFPLQGAMIAALVGDEHRYNSGLITFYEMLANDVIYADPLNFVTFADNHDIDRFFTAINEEFDLWKMGIAMLLTLRGIPQIYYGTEALMTNSRSGDHGLIRSGFPGGWDDDKVNVFSGEGLTVKQREAMAFLRTLLNWRKQKQLIHHGDLVHFAPEDGLYAFFRYDDNERVMVILNKNNKEVTPDMQRFAEMTHGFSTAADVITGKSHRLSQLTVPARSVMVLELE
jgi:neopullulanase